jgi:Flp pilus assembly pilin Flp
VKQTHTLLPGLGQSEQGQGLIEYLLIIALIAVVIVAVTVWIFYFIWGPVGVAFWPTVSTWGGNLVSRIQDGDPKSIFTGIVLFLLALFLILRYSRR